MVISCVLEEGKIEDGFQDSKEVATAANEGFTTTKKEPLQQRKKADREAESTSVEGRGRRKVRLAR